MFGAYYFGQPYFGQGPNLIIDVNFVVPPADDVLCEAIFRRVVASEVAFRRTMNVESTIRRRVDVEAGR
jgi:hypothetical protein